MTGIVEVLGFEIGAGPALVGFGVAAVSVLIVVRMAIKAITGIVVGLALRHGVYAAIAASGLGIETFVDGGLVAFLPAAIEWLASAAGIEVPVLLVGLV